MLATDWVGWPVQNAHHAQSVTHTGCSCRAPTNDRVSSIYEDPRFSLSVLCHCHLSDCPSLTLPSLAISDGSPHSCPGRQTCRGAWRSRHALAKGWRWARVPLHVPPSLCGPDGRYTVKTDATLAQGGTRLRQMSCDACRRLTWAAHSAPRTVSRSETDAAAEAALNTALVAFIATTASQCRGRKRVRQTDRSACNVYGLGIEDRNLPFLDVEARHLRHARSCIQERLVR